MAAANMKRIGMSPLVKAAQIAHRPTSAHPAACTTLNFCKSYRLVSPRQNNFIYFSPARNLIQTAKIKQRRPTTRANVLN